MILLKRNLRCCWLVFAFALALFTGCGYHTSGQAVRLPGDLHTIYVPMFENTTQTFRVEQVMTAAVVQELRSRTNYRIVSKNDGEADATLLGLVNYTANSPLTYDSVTGRISSSIVTIGMKVSLVGKSGKVLWDNPNYTYREQYQVSRDTASFFDESSSAFQRIATEFAKSLVSNLLEAY